MKKKPNARMTGAELKAELPRLGFTQVGFARCFGYGERTIRDWIAGDYPVPMIVGHVVKIMLKHKIKAEDLK
jgi:DNA-binding transcriptional regulator YiaG